MYIFRMIVFFSTLCTLALTCSVFASDASNYTAIIDKLHSYGSIKNNLSHVSDGNDLNGEQPSQWSPKLNDPKEDEFFWKLTELEILEKEGITLAKKGRILVEKSGSMTHNINILLDMKIKLLKQNKKKI